MEQIYDNRSGTYIDVPPELDAFLSDLDAIFRKHRLMLVKDNYDDIVVRELPEDRLDFEGHFLTVAKDYGDPMDFAGILRRYRFVRRAYVVPVSGIVCLEFDEQPDTAGYIEVTGIFERSTEVYTMDYVQEKAPNLIKRLQLVYEREE